MTEVSDREVAVRSYQSQLDRLASERAAAVAELGEAERAFAEARLRFDRAGRQVSHIDGRMDQLRELVRVEGS